MKIMTKKMIMRSETGNIDHKHNLNYNSHFLPLLYVFFFKLNCDR